ncbi:MAG: response regulator transcription factor [Bdellovibrio sp.]|nr:response regulator transcription factor [Bdellovibrio sp.]
MTDYKILVIDDEELARQKILRFLDKTAIVLPGNLVIEEAQNGLIGLAKISSFAPDLVFLDIQMPGLSGMELLQQIQDRVFKIIFATAHEEFALKAFEESACDYLLKPFDQERFDRALNKVLKLHSQERVLHELEDSYRSTGRYLEKITYKFGEKIKFIKVSEVLYFESREHYTYAITEEGEKLIDLSLAYLEEQLDAQKFLRIHRHVIVALGDITAFKKGEPFLIQLKNGIELPVSRNNRKKLLDKIFPC